jgi:hypothetical protein
VRPTPASVLLLATVVVPAQSLAQHPAWVTQLEVHLGWRFSRNEVAQVVNADASTTGVELNSALTYGGRAIFPVSSAPSPHLGKISFGVQGLAALGADMKVADTDAVIGQADYYQLGLIVGIGNFVPATPVNLTVNGALGVGIAHTAFSPSDGVTLVDQGNSVNSLVTNGTVGLDFYLTSTLSVVTSAGVNLGVRDPLDVSFVLHGGLAFRLPTSGGSGS